MLFQVDIINSTELDISLFMWKTFGNGCSYMYLRYKITTWKLKIYQANILHFEYRPKAKIMSCQEGVLDKMVGYPEHRLPITSIFEDLRLKAHKKNTKISEAPYKWMSRLSKSFLSELGVDLEKKTSDGKSVLHLCARVSEPSYLKCFLNKFDRVDDVDEEGRTPLHEACDSGNYTTAKLLLQSGANVNITTKSGSTPLMILSEKKVHDIKFFKLLLKYNASTDLENKSGMRAVDLVRNQDKNSPVISLIHPMFSQI